MYYVEVLTENKIPESDFLIFYENHDCVFTQSSIDNQYKIEVIFNNYEHLEIFLESLNNKMYEHNLLSKIFKGAKINKFNDIEKDNWKKFLIPIPITSNIKIVPPWFSEDKEKEIIINPSLAFGTGHHETTLACIRLLIEINNNYDLRDNISTILDIGTGTGILSILCSKIYSSEVIGIDNDSNAILQAESNLELNSFSSNVEFKLTEVELLDREFDLIIINISSEYILSKFKIIKSFCKSKSIFIVSGFLSSSFCDINRLFIKEKFSIIYMIHDNNWISVMVKRI